MAIRIQTRRGTAAQWTSANPVLAAGEQGYETDTGKIKIGDGTTAWAALPYPVDDAAAAVVDANPTIATHTAEFTRQETSPVIDLTHPRWGAAADGTTDDYAAIMAAYAALPAQGGTLHLNGRKFYSGQTLTFGDNKPVTIDGGAMGGVDKFTPGGGMLVFPMGIDGIVMPYVRPGTTGSNGHTLRNLAIVTTQPFWSPPTPGAGRGLTISTMAVRLDHVWINGFRSDGLYVVGNPTLAGANANHGVAVQLQSTFNGGHGVHLSGTDANAWVFEALDVTVNGGYGVYNAGRYHNTFIMPHASENTAGDYYDNGWSSHYLNPYSEMGGKFVIGKDSRYGTILGGGFGAPAIWTEAGGGTITEGATTARLYEWTVLGNGEWSSGIKIRSQYGGKYRWEFVTDAPNINHASIMAEGQPIISAGWDGTNRLVSFYGTNPISKPTVTGAKGANAALTSLIDALEALGLITDSTT